MYSLLEGKQNVYFQMVNWCCLPENGGWAPTKTMASLSNLTNVGKIIINHPPFQHFNRWYVYHFQMGGLWHCFTTIHVVQWGVESSIANKPTPPPWHQVIALHCTQDRLPARLHLPSQ